MPSVIGEIIQYIVSGIAIGCIYGLVALGFVLIYKATEVVNFAQGELMMLGAFIAYTFITILQLPYWVAFILTVVSMGLFGLLFDRIVLRRLVGEPAFAIVMVTIGFGIRARSVVSMVPGWGTDTYGFQTPFADKVLRPGGVVILVGAVSALCADVCLGGGAAPRRGQRHLGQLDR